jgi:excisionase family DNA binding protein
MIRSKDQTLGQSHDIREAQRLGSAREVAQAFGLAPETIRRLGRKGRIREYRLGRAVRFNFDEVLTLLTSQGKSS